jgi:hypothetical protein
MNKPYNVLVSIVLAMVSAGAAAAAPAVGDTYIYRVLNGYNHEVRGQITYRVDKVEADRVTVSVTPDSAALGTAHTEVYAADGNWLRHPLTNHDQPVEYEFTPAFPAFVFPLDTGKSWSMRVSAVNAVTSKRNSVRVDGEVGGGTHVQVPAGAFDAIKVTRHVYAGDWDGFLRETNITETEWYAPALGRAVRSEYQSKYIDTSRISRVHQWNLGDWNVVELVSVSAK